MHFLAGLPRSGSTLLGTLLSQHPDIFVSATSGLIDVMGAVAASYSAGPEYKSGKQRKGYDLLRVVAEEHYRDHPEKVVIDKSRGWPDPKIMEAMTEVQGAVPKIIATVRPVRECLASFIKISGWTGDPQEFCNTSSLAGHLFQAYATLKAGWDAAPDNFLFIEYADLIANPQGACDRVTDFLGLPRFEVALTGLSNPVPEKDEELWGIPNLHHVRPTVSKQEYDQAALLGPKLWKFYEGQNFWRSDEPAPEKTVLDFQLEAALHGDFDLGWSLCQQTDPDDDRAAFNKGWYLLRQGQFQEGFALLDRGRDINVFGNPSPSNRPMWDGRPLHGETVLLNLEGGLGDQICNVRFARNIASKGARVVVAGASELAPILCRVPGVSAYVQSAAAGGVYHDYWVPAMSAVRPLGLTWDTLSGRPYVASAPVNSVGGRLRVGIRWAGNPAFEHEQHRRFDPQELLNLQGVQLVSLQRDDSDTKLPEGVETPRLETWEDTVAAINDVDLVISSCTSVAHMAAAMGKPTWIIVPMLPYYLWSLPGDTTPWYNSVRLFRQTKFHDWSETFSNLRTALVELTQKEDHHVAMGV